MAQPSVIIFTFAGVIANKADGTWAANNDMLNVINNIKPEVELYLAVDVDKDCFDSTIGISEIKKTFSAEHVIFSKKFSSHDHAKSAFLRFANERGKQPLECLILTSDQRLSIELIDDGLPAGVILSAKRLERELLLRKLSKTEYVMHFRPV